MIKPLPLTCFGYAPRLTALWTSRVGWQQRTGKIIRLNDKAVTLQCDHTQWRVAYSFLHRVVDVDGMVQGVQ